MNYRGIMISLIMLFSSALFGMDWQGDDSGFYALTKKKVDSWEADYPEVIHQLTNLCMCDFSEIKFWSNIQDDWDQIEDLESETPYMYIDELRFLQAVEDDDENLIDQYLNNDVFRKKAETITFSAAVNIVKNKRLEQKIIDAFRQRHRVFVLLNSDAS